MFRCHARLSFVRALVVVILVAHSASTSLAHPPTEGDHASTEHASLPQALVLPKLDGAHPWSDKPVLDDPDRFHIAIMTDRTGGHRPGIWMKGVRGINLLRPEFVVSVGDLIEGYSLDRARVESEWKEFLGFIDQLDMKFFFVAGNHDVTNPLMHSIWREHFGREWYSFDYKGVHFVCLSSEDPSQHLGEEQLAWARDDLDANRDARWTLVFLHKPLWTYAERAMAAGNDDPTNWKQIEAMLGDRPHTVFSGHVHHYVQYDRKGMKYYHLATTGGGSRLRGVPYGEFDHVTWLVMEKDGPHVSNLMLDGILPADAVTEESIARFRSFLAKTAIEVAPILIADDAGFSSGEIHLRLTNEFDETVHIEGDIDGLPLRGLSVDPARLELTAAPGETTELAVRLEFSERVDFQHLAQTLFTARIRTPEIERPLSAERTLPVVIDRKFTVGAAVPSEIDGVLSEGHSFRFETGDAPTVVGAEGQWNGPGDASLEFDVTHDADHIYLSANVVDDAITDDDRVTAFIDTRPIALRSQDRRMRRGAYAVEIAARNEGAADAARHSVVAVRELGRGQLPDGIQGAASLTDEGYQLELAIPRSIVGSGNDAFQLCVAVADRDGDESEPCYVVWRGTPDFRSVNRNFAHFVLP